MPVATVNGYTLLPHPADWSAAVQWKRRWQTGIAASITGDEARQSLRALGREELTWQINPVSLEERAVLDERLDAASMSGLVCAPFWGRGSAITGWGANNTLLLADDLWNWQVNDYLFLMGECLTASLAPPYAWCVAQVTKVTAAATADTTTTTADSTIISADESGAISLSLSGPITADNSILTADSSMEDASQGFPNGMMVWPLLFGKFSMAKQSADDSWRGGVKVTLTELAARHQATLGQAPAGPGTGIGAMVIGSTFIVG